MCLRNFIVTFRLSEKSAVVKNKVNVLWASLWPVPLFALVPAIEKASLVAFQPLSGAIFIVCYHFLMCCWWRSGRETNFRARRRNAVQLAKTYAGWAVCVYFSPLRCGRLHTQEKLGASHRIGNFRGATKVMRNHPVSDEWIILGDNSMKLRANTQRLINRRVSQKNKKRVGVSSFILEPRRRK